MLRRLFPFLLTIVVVALVAAFALPPKPAVRSVGATFRIAPDSSVIVTATIHLTGQLQPGDSIRYAFQRGDSAQSVVVTTALTRQATMPAPAYGATATYRTCARVKRKDALVGAFVCSARWTYTRPAAEPPVIDSVVQVVLREVPSTFHPLGIAYASVAGKAVTDSSRIQYCAFAVLKSGARVRSTNTRDVPGCEEVYQRWLGEVTS